MRLLSCFGRGPNAESRGADAGDSGAALATTTLQGEVPARSRSFPLTSRGHAVPASQAVPATWTGGHNEGCTQLVSDAVCEAGLRSPAHPRPNTERLIRYQDLQFNELISKGAFKTVYRGKWNGTRVAIVCMRKGGLVAEARLLQQVSSHPNIVQFYGVAIDPVGNEYMVMEYAELGSLQHVLMQRGRKLRTRQRLKMCQQVCNAMCELANEGIRHQDLAARNVLVSNLDPMLVKVADLGLATSMELHSSRIFCMDAVEQQLVSIRWAPPEVLQHGLQEWSQKADVYQYGVFLWEVFSEGCEPYADMSVREVYDAVRAGRTLPKPHRCPQEMYQLMLRCWASDACERPDFIDILNFFQVWQQEYGEELSKKEAHDFLLNAGELCIMQPPSSMELDNRNDMLSGHQQATHANQHSAVQCPSSSASLVQSTHLNSSVSGPQLEKCDASCSVITTASHLQHGEARMSFEIDDVIEPMMDKDTIMSTLQDLNFKSSLNDTALHLHRHGSSPSALEGSAATLASGSHEAAGGRLHHGASTADDSHPATIADLLMAGGSGKWHQENEQVPLWPCSRSSIQAALGASCFEKSDMPAPAMTAASQALSSKMTSGYVNLSEMMNEASGRL